jgi:hypothetical protein
MVVFWNSLLPAHESPEIPSNWALTQEQLCFRLLFWNRIRTSRRSVFHASRFTADCCIVDLSSSSAPQPLDQILLASKPRFVFSRCGDIIPCRHVPLETKLNRSLYGGRCLEVGKSYGLLHTHHRTMSLYEFRRLLSAIPRCFPFLYLIHFFRKKTPSFRHRAMHSEIEISYTMSTTKSTYYV